MQSSAEQAHVQGTAPTAGHGARDFHVLITTQGGIEGYKLRCAEAIDAAMDGADRLAGRAGKVEVRPDIERTFLEGKARYPEQLHAQAHVEALRGWLAAEELSRLRALMPRHQVTRERTGEGLDASSTPVCSCGWRGHTVDESDDFASSNLRTQEQQHVQGAVL